MGNCCSDEAGHGGAHPVGPAAAKAAQAASAAADRFLRSRGAGASTQIEVRGPPRYPCAFCTPTSSGRPVGVLGAGAGARAVIARGGGDG